MDGFTFTAEIIKSIAWPCAAIVLVSLLRKPIIDLLPLMRKLKYKELELEFSQEVLALKSEVSDRPSESADTGGKARVTSSKAMNLVSLSTRAAIMEAWIELETAAVEVASSFWSQAPNDVMRNYSKLGEYLHHCKVLNDKQLVVFQKLRQLRNKSAHAEGLNLNEDDARAYVEMAANLTQHIKSF